jgi:ABC-type bacteriocin/lantibiotic exporter with double-glycine peptidase domain
VCHHEKKAILGELPLLGGSRHGSDRCSVALSPQEPWIMAGTVEENILFGLPREQARLERVVDVCALRKDVEQLPGGLATEVMFVTLNILEFCG